MNPSRIVDMASNFYDSCVLFAASDFGIFAKLAELKQANSETVAKACGMDTRGANLLLDACVALGLLNKEGNQYSNTPESSLFLVAGSPADLTKAIRYNRDVYPAWGKLADMVKTGKPVERPEIHLGEDKDRTRNFVLSMHGRALGIGRAVVPQLNLQGKRKLFDVGGGPGTYSTLIARANPDIVCTVLDLPEVVKVAGELIQAEGMQNRVKTMAGDYHTAQFPGRNDVVIFFGVLHQESPESISNLFKHTYDSLTPGGVVYVLDMMTDSTHTRPKFSALFAVNMALTTKNGWVFSDQELEGWLTGAGFTGFSCRPLSSPMPHWLASAKKQ
ncbi:MAG: methyltransferase [Kiritimatiellae bacterium]|nr:methyltransferase [Kiritimatiellia bacterium]MDD5520537.1 methyltransferase [Kiritimatiellia bacterium]